MPRILSWQLGNRETGFAQLAEPSAIRLWLYATRAPAAAIEKIYKTLGFLSVPTALIASTREKTESRMAAHWE
jgi:hypothetical protein